MGAAEFANPLVLFASEFAQHQRHALHLSPLLPYPLRLLAERRHTAVDTACAAILRLRSTDLGPGVGTAGVVLGGEEFEYDGAGEGARDLPCELVGAGALGMCGAQGGGEFVAGRVGGGLGLA